MRRVRWAAPLLCTLVAGSLACSSGPPARTEVLLRDDGLDAAFTAGFAIAPTAHLRPVADSAEVAATFSNALYIESMTQLRGTDVVSPDFVLDRLGEAGDTVLEEFRQLRRRLVRDELLPPELTTSLRTVLGERYVLVSWVDEKQVVGLEDMSGDYVDADYSLEVQRASYAQLEGEIVGCLVDLQGSRVLWKGQAHYESGRDFAGNEGPKSGDRLARERGAFDLIGLFH